MSSETHSSSETAVVPKSAPPSATGLPLQQTAAGSMWPKLLEDATKYTVLAVFILYSIGYIIWHAYLGTYGITSIAFLQSEYLSSAFCFIFTLAIFGIAPAMITESVIAKDAADKYAMIANLWYVTCILAWGIFFPNVDMFKDHTFSYLFFSVLVAALLLNFCVTRFASKTKFRFLASLQLPLPSIIWVVFALYTLLTSDSLNTAFFISVMGFVPVLVWFGKTAIPNLARDGFLMQSVFFLFFCLLSGMLVLSFGAFQFGKFPKSVF